MECENFSAKPRIGNQFKIDEMGVLNSSETSIISGVAIRRDFQGADRNLDSACREIDRILTDAGISCTYSSFDGPWEEPSELSVLKSLRSSATSKCEYTAPSIV